MKIRTLAAALACLTTSSAYAAPVFMSAEWAAEACAAWNANEELVTGLGGDWIDNNAARGYKVIHVYRQDCKDSPRVELTISKDDDKAKCSYGGAVEHQELNDEVDYLMYATDEDWVCMGEGKWGCGPKLAMMTFKLKFEGPKMEAMSVTGPFEQFLLLTGKVESDRSSCP
jgi:putative sterol carrier protein